MLHVRMSILRKETLERLRVSRVADLSELSGRSPSFGRHNIVGMFVRRRAGVFYNGNAAEGSREMDGWRSILTVGATEAEPRARFGL